MAILELPPSKWELQQNTSLETKEGGLGDGYTLTGGVPFSLRGDFNLTFPGLTELEFTELWELIKSYAGFQTFEWRPFDYLEYKTYVFTEPKASHQGEGMWEVGVTLKEMAPFIGSVDPLSQITTNPFPQPIDQTINCGAAATSGGTQIQVYEVLLGVTTGSVTLSYQAFSIPDQFELIYNNQLLLDTGYISGSGTFTFSKPTSTPTSAFVRVTAELSGTAWNFSMSCPS